MRKIKFRTWDKNSKQMFKVYSLEFRDDGIWVQLDQKSKVTGMRENWLSPDRSILMQFTGLIDRNGKEIYEGDIVKVLGTKYIDSYIGQVDYDYGKFWIVKHNGYGGEGYDFDRLTNKDTQNFTSELEVVGNIYEK